MNDDLKKKFLLVLPHLRFAAEEAKKEGNVELGILATKPDGTGKLLCRFNAEEFIEDLGKLLEAPPLTDEERLDAKAVRFLTTHSLKGGM